MFIALCCITLAIFLAWAASHISVKVQRRLFLFLSVFLPASELIKQLLLYFTNDRSYQWWYFPFQLCSMPLYLLPVWYVLSSAERQTAGSFFRHAAHTLAVFLMDFGLLGGIAVFVDQSGMQYELPILTFHSYLWHFLMIFLALYLFLTGNYQLRIRDFVPPGILFLVLTGIATGFNILFHPKGSINMFYISPYHDMGQIVFQDIALQIGQAPAKILYVISILFGAFLIHLILSMFHGKGPQRPFIKQRQH